MWTYTGTVAFSAPEVFTGEGYEYTNILHNLVKWLICGVQVVSYTPCCQVHFHSHPYSIIYPNIFSLNDLIEDIKKGEFVFP